MRNLVRLCCALAVAALIAAASSPAAFVSSARPRAAAGATITVNSTADIVGDDGKCTLREALNSAANDAPSGAASGECAAGSGDDTINIAVTGTINLTDMLSTTTNVSIVGPGSSSLTLKSVGSPHRVFFANVSTVSISGLTITGGSFSPGGGSGGGIVNGVGVMTLTDVVVTDNHTPDGTAGFPAAGSGGGVLNSGTLTLVNCAVTNNSTGNAFNTGSNEGGRGGGIDSGNGSLTLVNTIVSGNHTGGGPGKGGDGGGIFIGGTGATLTGSTVSNNSTGAGGPGGTSGGHGGGIYNAGETLTLTGSTISGNSTGQGGDGGGLYVQGSLTATNSTFSGNQSRGGGGIWLIDGSHPSRLTNCTIADNVASLNGTGVSSFASTTVGNTIIAHNIGAGTDATGGFVSQGHNVVGAESGNSLGFPSFTQPTDKVGTENARLDPRLGPLANNGGPTKTHALLTGSPAIEAGDNALAVDASNNALTTDQRGTGFPRFADSADADTTQTVDIGAYEAHPTVEDIADKTTSEDSTLSFNFNVGDAVAGLSSVTAASSDTTLVPNDSAHINVTGTGSQRTLSITPTADASGTTTITLTATAANGQTATDTFPLTVTPANDQPTGMALSNNVVADNSPADTNVGTLSTTDIDAGDTFTYSLVGGAGGLDNGSFAVSGSTLKTSAVIDYETKRTYSVRVRSTDSGGLFFEKVFLVNVSDGPDTPGALSFSAANYSVNEAAGNVTITLRRTGGADNKAVARVGLADVTTSPADYVYAPGSLDTSFNPGSGADEIIRAVAVQPDGKTIIVGGFTNYNGVARSGVARLNADGSLDTSFNPGSGTSASLINSVAAVVLQPDGRVLIGGNFTSYNGTPINGIARLNSDGSLDTSFNPGSGANNGIVRAVALQPDGKVFIGGDFNGYNGVARGGVARLNADGSLDTSFDPGSGVDNSVRAIVLQPDGRVFIGGDFTSYNGTNRNRVARLNADGSLDTSFNPGSGVGIGIGGSVTELALQPDGKLLIGGAIASYNGTSVNGLVRANSDGSRDASFNPGFVNQVGVAAVLLQPDGKVIAGMYSSDGAQPTTLARLNTGGSLDPSFNVGTGPSIGVFAAALQTDGKVVIGGSFNTYNDTPRTRIARVNGDLFVTWEAGDSSDKTVSLPIVNDALPEQNETLALSLNALGASAGSPSSATLTINDDETVVSSVSGSGVYGGTATLTATLTLAGSPLPGKTITFFFGSMPVGTATTDASGVATLTGVSLSLFDAGTYTSVLGATFAGEPGLSGSGALGVLNIAKASQTINFGALADKAYGDGIFQLSATASSGLSVSYNSSGTCFVADGTFVHLTGAGSCTITASQAGNINYTAATSVVRTFQIAKAATTTTVISSANPSAVGQDVAFTIKVTSAAGTPSGYVQIEVEGGGSSTLHLDGINPVVFGVGGLTAGTHAVNASFEGNDNFAPSSTSLAGGQVVGSLFEFSRSSYNVAEGASLTVTVRRTGDTSQAASVDYATDDGSTPSVFVPCSTVTGLALDRCDFTKALGTLNFAAGESEKTFVVLGSDDSFTEGPETAGLKLSNPSSNSVLGAGSVAAFTINDDSPESSGNAADDTEKFVTQHYRDFLNRDPDAPGLAFWKNQIESCNSDAQCREVRRIHVSAAFFLSIEFQNTGYLVERTYKTAYGDATSPGVSGTVPVVRLNEFLPDTQRIGRDLIVGQGNWEAQLEANKVAYFQEFVARPRFANAFPVSLTPAQFVDALFQNAGVTPTSAERQAAIDEFGGAANTANTTARARTLRRVAENPTLQQQELNRAFVLMEYFGYLRRNPDDAPEPTLNFAGWKFWLGKLNQFNGDFVKAEMVKAFISSDEYRKRFGQ